MGIRVVPAVPQSVAGSVVGSSGQLATTFGPVLGVIMFYNASPYDMTARTEDGNTLVAPANCRKRVPLYNPSQFLTWTVITVPNSTNAPTYTIQLELYDDPTQAPKEDVVALGRQFNLGNAVPVSQSATSVANDGNAVPTSVVEATPSGSASSELEFFNDGSGKFAGGNIQFNAAGQFTAIAAGGVPTSALSAGAVPSGVTVPAANVTGTLPAAQVGSGYPAAILGAGTVPAGVAVPAANVTGTLPAAQVGSGYPGADVSGAVALASKVSAVDDATMTQGHPITRADQSLAALGFGLNGGSAAGVNAYDKNANVDGQAVNLNVNNYFDGTNDRFVNAAVAYQYQLLGGTGLRWRQSTGTPVGGGIITWSAWQTLIDTNGDFQGGVPLSVLLSGALPAGVTLPAGQVTGTLPASQVGTGYPATDLSGSVPTTQAVASANGSVTAPQLQTNTSGAGLSANDNKADGFVELYPTETDGTARGIQFDYIDTGGTLHAGVFLSNAGSLKFAPTGDIYRVGSFFGGTGAGTFSHGLHLTPLYVGVTTTQTNSTETVGVDSIGSSTVHINQGVAGWPWVAMATA